MIEIRLEETGGQTIARTERMLARIPGAMDKAVRNAMTRAVSALRSNTKKAVRSRYAISSGNLRTNDNVRVRYSYQGGVRAEVVFSGSKIPLFRYSGASPSGPVKDTSRKVHAKVHGEWRTVNPGVPAAGHQLVSTSPKRFNNAFVARMGSGHVGIFARTGGAASGDGDEVKEIMGSSMPQMIGHEQVAAKLDEIVAQKFLERLEHEAERILSGAGG